MGSYRYRGISRRSHIPYRSLIEALYTLNSPPLASFKGFRVDPRSRGSRFRGCGPLRVPFFQGILKGFYKGSIESGPY